MIIFICYYYLILENFHSKLFTYSVGDPKLIDDDKVDITDESNNPRWINLSSLKNKDFQPGVEEIIDIILNKKL